MEQWRRRVSRLIWDQETAGSNPACSTSGIAAKNRREGPCERYIISHSGVSATLRGAAPDLGAARIHARSERPENPSRQPDTVVHIRIRVAGTRWAKEIRPEKWQLSRADMEGNIIILTHNQRNVNAMNGLFWVCAISIFLAAVLPDVGKL